MFIDSYLNHVVVPDRYTPQRKPPMRGFLNPHPGCPAHTQQQSQHLMCMGCVWTCLISSTGGFSTKSQHVWMVEDTQLFGDKKYSTYVNAYVHTIYWGTSPKDRQIASQDQKWFKICNPCRAPARWLSVSTSTALPKRMLQEGHSNSSNLSLSWGW